MLLLQYAWNYTALIVLSVAAFHLSLISTSLPPTADEREQIERAIVLLEERGFINEAGVLRSSVTFRSTDNWLNSLIEKEEAYAAANFPFQIITNYPDFYNKAVDDTERAAILLHESRHLFGEDENQAYAYVWQNRERRGWTLRTHGTTASYITIEQQTREMAPELFTCPGRTYSDCTEW
ncbi:hypothetical protein BH24ACI3_BH24ACI3_13000 [soil metagenome]